MRKELDWQGKTILVKRGQGHSGRIECDGFKATQRELEILYLKAKGLTHKEIARNLFIELQTSKHHLDNLRHRNSEGDEACLPTTYELINKAEELELLNPYAIRGLESILERI